MPSQDNIPPASINSFLSTSRLYLRLHARHASQSPPSLRLRPIWRSLMIVGSIGTVLGQPVFAADTLRMADGRESRNRSTMPENQQPLDSTQQTLFRKTQS